MQWMAAPYYEMKPKQAMEELEKIKEVVKENWRQLAQKYAVSRGEIDRMIPAFKECDN